MIESISHLDERSLKYKLWFDHEKSNDTTQISSLANSKSLELETFVIYSKILAYMPTRHSVERETLLIWK